MEGKGKEGENLKMYAILNLMYIFIYTYPRMGVCYTPTPVEVYVTHLYAGEGFVAKCVFI